MKTFGSFQLNPRNAKPRKQHTTSPLAFTTSAFLSSKIHFMPRSVMRLTDINGQVISATWKMLWILLLCSPTIASRFSLS